MPMVMVIAMVVQCFLIASGILYTGYVVENDVLWRLFIGMGITQAAFLAADR